MIQLKINNPKALKKMHKGLDDALTEGIKQGMQRIGMHLTNMIKKDLTKKSKGSVRVVRRGKKVWQSLAGTSPNHDTGALRSSILWDLGGNNDEVTVGTTLKYGRYLEDGTKKMKPHPFIKTNAEKHERDMAAILIESIRKKVETAGR